MKNTSGDHPEISFYDNQVIEYYVRKARVMRAEYIASMFRLTSKRILSLFKHDKRTAANRAGKPVRV